MTPPAGVQPKKAYDYSLEDSQVWKQPPCNTNCHAAPPDALKKSDLWLDPNFSLLDANGAPLNKVHNQKFIVDYLKKTAKKPAAQPVAPPPPPVDVTPLLAEAQKLEKIAETSKSGTERIDCYRSAARLYQMAQNVEAGKKFSACFARNTKAQNLNLASPKLTRNWRSSMAASATR